MRKLGFESYLRIVDTVADVGNTPEAYKAAARFLSQEAVTTTGDAPGAVQALLAPGAPIGRVRWPCSDPQSYGVNSWHSDAVLCTYRRPPFSARGTLTAHTGRVDDPDASPEAFVELVEGEDFTVAGQSVLHDGCLCVLVRGTLPGDASAAVAYSIDPTIVSNLRGPDNETPSITLNGTNRLPNLTRSGSIVADLLGDNSIDPDRQLPFDEIIHLVRLRVNGVHPSIHLQFGFSDYDSGGSRLAVTRGEDEFGNSVLLQSVEESTVAGEPVRTFSEFSSIFRTANTGGRSSQDPLDDAYPTRGAIRTGAYFRHDAEGAMQGPIDFLPAFARSARSGGDFTHRAQIVLDALQSEAPRWVVEYNSQFETILGLVEERLDTIRTNSKELRYPSWEPEPEPNPGKPQPPGGGETGDNQTENQDDNENEDDLGNEIEQIEEEFGGGGEPSTVRRGGAAGGGTSTSSQDGGADTDLPDGWSETEIPEDADPDYVGVERALDAIDDPSERERLRNQYYRDRREYGNEIALQLLRTGIAKLLARQNQVLANVNGVSGMGLPQIGHIKALGVIAEGGGIYEMSRETLYDSSGNVTRRGTGAGWIGVGPSELASQQDWMAGSGTTDEDLSDTMLMLYGAQTSLGFGCLPGEYGAHGIASGTQISLQTNGGLHARTYDDDAQQIYDAYHQTDATTAAQGTAIPLSSTAVVIPDGYRGFAHDFLDVSTTLDVGDNGAYFDVIDLCGCA